MVQEIVIGILGRNRRAADRLELRGHNRLREMRIGFDSLDMHRRLRDSGQGNSPKASPKIRGGRTRLAAEWFGTMYSALPVIMGPEGTVGVWMVETEWSRV